MIVRPPSNIREYDAFFSGDPALAPKPEKGTPDELKAHEHKMQVARETGQWSDIVITGQHPTRFVMRILRGAQYRWIADQMLARNVMQHQAASLAFRCACSSIVNFGDLEMKTFDHAALGKILSTEVTDELDLIDPMIVTELGGDALRRAQEVSPKSSRA